jgi:hypothetical protein
MSALRHDPHRHGSVAPAAACPTWDDVGVGREGQQRGEATKPRRGGRERAGPGTQEDSGTAARAAGRRPGEGRTHGTHGRRGRDLHSRRSAIGGRGGLCGCLPKSLLSV